jgi:hypothetical protein
MVRIKWGENDANGRVMYGLIDPQPAQNKGDSGRIKTKLAFRAKFLPARARWEVAQTKKYPASPLGIAAFRIDHESLTL